jgi:hypothetical protein
MDKIVDCCSLPPQLETLRKMDESKMGKRSLDQMSKNNNNNAQATGDDPMVRKVVSR